MSEPQLYGEINFLPTWYVRSRGQRRSGRRQLLLLAVMICGMITLLLLTRSRLTDYKLYYTALQQEINAAGGRMVEVVKLQQVQEALNRESRMYDELLRPVTYSQIADTIGALTPEAIFLTSLNVHSGEGKRTRVLAETDAATNRSKTVTEGYELIRVEMKGVAPSNVDIANYVGRLASGGLFSNVKMLQSHQGRIGDVLTRTFEITMEIPVDRSYEFVPAAEGVVDAN